MVRFLKYNTLSAPVIHASGIEARMIEAEAALAAGDNTTWLAKLNAATVEALATPVRPVSRMCAQGGGAPNLSRGYWGSSCHARALSPRSMTNSAAGTPNC